MKKLLIIISSLIFIPVFLLVGYLHLTGERRPGDQPPVTSNTYDQSYAASVQEAETWLQDTYASTSVPSISVAVGVDGETIWEGAIGYADLSEGILATPDHLYRIASVSKTLTAAALIQLHEQGQLNINTAFQEYVPDYAITTPFSLKQLATHQAGIRNYWDAGFFKGFTDAYSQEHFSIREAAAIVEFEPLLFEPGSDWHYSGFGYSLLALAMEESTGRQFADIITEDILSPLGMNSTYLDAKGAEHPNTSSYYLALAGAIKESPERDASRTYAGGGFLSTPGDLVRFGNALLNVELLSKDSRDLLWTPVPLSNGDLHPDSPNYSYGLGFYISEGELGQSISHAGSGPGGRAQLSIFPDQNLVVAIAINANPVVFSSSINPRIEAVNIARMFMR